MKKSILWLAVAMVLLASCSTIDYSTCQIARVGDLQGVKKQSFQGMAVYGDYMVSLQNTGQATLYQLGYAKDKTVSMTRLRQFPLASAGSWNHANVAFFGKERYQKGDYFPLLYVSQCSKERHDGMKDVCYVERISLDGAPLLV